MSYGTSAYAVMKCRHAVPIECKMLRPSFIPRGGDNSSQHMRSVVAPGLCRMRPAFARLFHAAMRGRKSAAVFLMPIAFFTLILLFARRQRQERSEEARYGGDEGEHA